MVSRDQIESVLGRIRPMMQADGGDIELVEVQGNSAHVRLTGMCAGCPSAHMTLYMGVEMALRDEIKKNAARLAVESLDKGVIVRDVLAKCGASER